MTVGQITLERFIVLLSNQGIRVRVGPFNVQINVTSTVFANQLYLLYKDYELVENDIAEFHVRVVSARSIKRPFTSHVRFLLDGQSPFPILPEEQALAALEWGINLSIAVRVNHLLLFHSAVVERNGQVIVAPALPGSGKTTLCVALVHRGYRLFSDEFGLLDPQRGEFLPIPRLMPLKNESIGVIENYLPEAQLGQKIPNTQKGTIAHVCPPKESIVRSRESAKARWIVFPKWVADTPLRLEQLPDSEAFLLLANNSFNYEVMGESGFQAVTHLIKTCDCYQLVYSDFDDLINAMNDLTN